MAKPCAPVRPRGCGCDSHPGPAQATGTTMLNECTAFALLSSCPLAAVGGLGRDARGGTPARGSDADLFRRRGDPRRWMVSEPTAAAKGGSVWRRAHSVGSARRQEGARPRRYLKVSSESRMMDACRGSSAPRGGRTTAAGTRERLPLQLRAPATSSACRGPDRNSCVGIRTAV